MDPKDPKTDRRVAELTGGGWEVADWSPDDKQLLLVEGISINETYLWLVDVATGTEDAADAQGRRGQGRLRQRARSRATARASTSRCDRGSEFQRLAYMDLATKAVTFLTPDTADVDGLRPLARRQDDRLRDQREGRRASCTSSTRPRARRSRARSCRSASIGGVRLAPGRHAHRVHDDLGALERGRLLLRRRRPGRSSAGP